LRKLVKEILGRYLRDGSEFFDVLLQIASATEFKNKVEVAFGLEKLDKLDNVSMLYSS